MFFQFIIGFFNILNIRSFKILPHVAYRRDRVSFREFFRGEHHNLTIRWTVQLQKLRKEIKAARTAYVITGTFAETNVRGSMYFSPETRNVQQRGGEKN